MTEHIAFYGKGGSGKTSMATNVAAALAESGHTVALIGCCPRADSVVALHPEGGTRPVLAVLDATPLSEVMGIGLKGVACIEVGDVMAKGICVARGIDRALSGILELGLLTAFQPEYVLYDMPGETGCPGFRTPLLDTLLGRAYLVTSADLMSLYAVNAQLEQLHRNSKLAGIGVGIIANGVNASFEEALVKDFAHQLGVSVVGSVPRSLVVRQCELYGKTVLEAAPLSNHAYTYRKVARQVAAAADVGTVRSTRPKGEGELQSWARGWGDRIAELEYGLMEGGAGI